MRGLLGPPPPGERGRHSWEGGASRGAHVSDAQHWRDQKAPKGGSSLGSSQLLPKAGRFCMQFCWICRTVDSEWLTLLPGAVFQTVGCI